MGLQSLGRKCWSAWLRHHDNIALENMKNNDRAKKVAIMLEKIARGLVHRQFSAFVRYLKIAAEERAAQDAINARLANLDEWNKAKLRIFLDAKRLGKMATFFKFWADFWRNAGVYQLQDSIAQEDAAIKELEDRIAQAEAALSGNSAKLTGQRGVLADLEHQIQNVQSQIRDLERQLANLKSRTNETEDMVYDESNSRRSDQAKIKELERQLDALLAEQERLGNELADIAGDIGFVHKETHF